MKLNNRGWGLQAMLAGVLVLMIALVIIAVLVNKTFDNIMPSINDENNYESVNQDTETDTKLKYSDLEDKVLEAAKVYQKRYYNDIPKGDAITVSIKKLQENGLIDNIADIKDPNINCLGYATFEKQDDIVYRAYIKCGSNYQTVGYQNYE